MYAYEMQICCYNVVKYFVEFKFHFYHGLMLAFDLHNRERSFSFLGF
jgi:hypothetical protein